MRGCGRSVSSYYVRHLLRRLIASSRLVTECNPFSKMEAPRLGAHWPKYHPLVLNILLSIRWVDLGNMAGSPLAELDEERV